MNRKTGSLRCYNCRYDAEKETIEEARARVDKDLLVKPMKNPPLTRKRGQSNQKPQARKKTGISCAVCGKNPPNVVRKDGSYYCTVCGYESSKNTYIPEYKSAVCNKCGSTSKYFRKDGTMVCQRCKNESQKFDHMEFISQNTPVTNVADHILPFTSPEVTINGKVLSLFVDKKTMKLSVDGAEKQYPVNKDNNVVFTIGELGKIDVDYRDPVSIMRLYIRILKHASVGKAAFEKVWKTVVVGTPFDFEPLTVLQLIERGLLSQKKVETQLIPLINENLSSASGRHSPKSLCWAAEKSFEMGIYGTLEKEIRDTQDLIKEYELKAKAEAEARKKELMATGRSDKAATMKSDSADENSMKLPEYLENVSKTQVLMFGDYRLHYTLSSVEKV